MKPDQNKNVFRGMHDLAPFAPAFAAALLTACATAAAPADAPIVRHYPVPEIVVGTSNSGRFETNGGCIYFRFENRPDRRPPALFATGTKLSPDRRSIVLPGGKSIRFGRTVTIAFEAPPNATGLNSTCGADPILILKTVE